MAEIKENRHSVRRPSFFCITSSGIGNFLVGLRHRGYSGNFRGTFSGISGHSGDFAKKPLAPDR